MTQEEKAKAYDEAIKKAKEIKEKIVYSHLSTESCKAVSEYIDTIIPEFSARDKYDGRMDKECIGLCNILNSLPGVQTFESCCGHLKDKYSIWFFCENIDSLSRLGRCVERNYSDGKWELLVDSTDTHPRGVFWLRSKEPFVSIDEMNRSITFLIQSIMHWFDEEFDHYFSGGMTNTLPTSDYSGLTDFEQAIHRGFLCAGIENVPVEIIKETAKDCLAHLPFSEEYKQGYEVAKNIFKSAEWSEEDETGYMDLMRCIEVARKSAKDENDMGNAWYAEHWLKTRLKSLRPQPKQEWSEEDVRALNNAIVSLSMYANGQIPLMLPSLILENVEQLKSLRDRGATCAPHWKPSKEQMEALKCAVNDSIMMYDPYSSPLKEEVTRIYSENLQSLHEQLNKL